MSISHPSNMLESARFVTSQDGTEICTYSAGDATKPAIVFIHGFACTALVFSKQLGDPELRKECYLVSLFRLASSLFGNSCFRTMTYMGLNWLLDRV